MTLHATRDEAAGTVTVHCTYGPTRFTVEEYEGHARSFARELLRLVPDEPPENRARRGYERYFRSCGGKSVHGDQLPPWDGLPDSIREHWTAAFDE